MMGYTHAVVGAAGAVGMAVSAGYTTPEAYIIASTMGALGGAALDIDADNHFSNPTMTDAIRTLATCIGMIVLSVALDLVLKTGIITAIISERNNAIVGFLGFLILMGVGHFTDHRTFTHSLLFTALTTLCIGLIYIDAAPYYLGGCVLHLILDMFNHKVPNHGINHGIWLLYPLKIGKGVAFGVCRSDREANKALYFIGLTLYVVATIYFITKVGNITKSIAPIVILVYMVVVMHFVREKSEREVWHIRHMHGEF